MAIGDKFFLADKETQDTINRNVGDIHSRVGTTTDPDGSKNSGTLMGKINAVIGNILDIRSWVVSYLNATVASRQSEEFASARYENLNANTMANHTPSATGNLSQKLAHLITLVSNNTVKHKKTRQAVIGIPGGAAAFAINATGPGEIIAIHVNGSVTCTLVADGVTYTQTLNASQVYSLGMNFENGIFTIFDKSRVETANQPFCWAVSCKLSFTGSSGTTVRVLYNLYE